MTVGICVASSQKLSFLICVMEGLPTFWVRIFFIVAALSLHCFCAAFCSCGAWASLCGGFSSCGTWPLGLPGFSSGSRWAQELWFPGSRVQAWYLWGTGLTGLCHMESSRTRDQMCLLYGQADSYH